MHSPNVQFDHKAVEVRRFASRFCQASKIISALVATLGVVVLCGWVFNVPALTYIRPTLQSMKVNTALSFLCLGAGLWLAGTDDRQRSRRILGLLVVLIAGSTLAEYAFHISLGIDQLLFRDTRTPSLSAYPGRMAIATAICFLFLGSAVMLLGLRKALVLQRALVVPCFAFSLVALYGYLYGVKSLYSITSFSTVGVHTSAGLMAVCLAYFLARPDEGIVSIAASDSNSGFLLRTLGPAIIVVPILIGWLTLEGQRANLYDTKFGVALLVIGNIGCLTILTTLIARSMHGLECERSHAIDDLRESEERFRLVANSAPALIWMSGTDKLWTYFNKPWLDFTGRSLESELGNGWAEGVHPNDLPRYLDTYTQSFDRRENFRMEHRLRDRNGEYRWILDVGVPRFTEDGSFAGYIGICVDVTERKRAEQALHETNRILESQTAVLRSQEDLLKIFVKNVPAGVAMLDCQMRYLQVSERWCADYGVAAPQLLGHSHYEIFPDIPQRWKEMHSRALEGDTFREQEDRWDRQGGIATWLRWEIRPWKTPSGDIGGILIFAEDITRRKHAEEELLGMSRKLIEAHEHERTRIGRDLHDDVVQRLALLAIELEGVQRDVPDSVGELGRRIGDLRDQTTQITNDVQLLSHELHSSKLDYLGIVGAAKNFCKEFSERQKVEIDFQSHDLPAALPNQLSLALFRVIQEALRNATKHSGVKRFEVRLWESTGEINLTVCDLGAGFDTETAMKSTGLGLTSMQERVRLVGGELSINSQPKGGTTIHARVPFDSTSDSAQAAG